MKIGKTKLGKDYEGDPCLIVTYTFTNNSDEKMSAASACNFEAYQANRIERLGEDAAQPHRIHRKLTRD